jgi:hypothetical protein
VRSRLGIAAWRRSSSVAPVLNSAIRVSWWNMRKNRSPRSIR